MNHAVTFGFPDFWPKVYGSYRRGFDAVAKDAELANEIFGSVQLRDPVQIVVFMLVRMTASGLNELLILAGNGAGMGAMKICRGMFESAVMAEYIRQHPKYAQDYLDYGRVLMWKRVQQAEDRFTPEQVQEAEARYLQVKRRFEDKKGRVRNQWNRVSIADMARDIGRTKQYELPYSIAASMHHGNAEAMISSLQRNPEKISIDAPPTETWVLQSLISGHVYLLQALATLNACLGMGFDIRIDQANSELIRVWSADGKSSS